MSALPVDPTSCAEVPAGLLEQLCDDAATPYVRPHEVDRMRSSVDRPAFDRRVATIIATRLLELSHIA